MNHYAISFNNGDGTVSIVADYMVISDGFVQFRIDGPSGFSDICAAYNSNIVDFCRQQKAYTEEEILEQIKQANEGKSA